MKQIKSRVNETRAAARAAMLACAGLIALFALARADVATAASDCNFTISGSTMSLDADCTTDETILIPDGMTLDGNDHTITAVDPPGGHFTGAVVANAGATAHVHHLTVRAAGLSNVCDDGDERLRGIMFEGASGSIEHNDVLDINQGPSGCQEGNAIEVRNAPFDGTHPGTVVVEIAHNTVDAYQKTGIVANGDVDVDIHHNDVSESATQNNLAPNSVQLAYGATGSVQQNRIDGNQWLGASDYASTAFLIYLADDLNVSNNNIRGNSDIALYIYGNDGTYDNNRVFDEGPDGGPNDGFVYDYGIGNWGNGNSVTNNKVKGFEIPYDGVTGGNNKTLGIGGFGVELDATFGILGEGFSTSISPSVSPIE